MDALLITPYYACNKNTGAGQRTQLLFKSLLQLEGVSHVDVLVLDERERDATSFFEGARKVCTAKIKYRGQIGLWRLIRPIRASIVDALATTFGKRSIGYSGNMLSASKSPLPIENYAYIFGRYLRPTSISGCFESLDNTPLFLDVDDRDDVLYSSRLETPNINPIYKAILKWHLAQVKKIQQTLLPRCAHLWVASDKDIGELPARRESVLPNIPFTLGEVTNDTLAPSTPETKNILFVGSFGHRINKEGVETFLDHCWPKIIDKTPEATLRIVGSGGWQNIDEKYKHMTNVEVVGFCDSLEDEYKNCAFSIVPLFEGGGTKIKVLESFLYNRLAVGTQHAYFGYDKIAENCPSAIGNDYDDLADKAVHFLSDHQERNQLADTARQQVKESFTFDAFKNAVHNAVITYKGAQ